MERLKNGEIEQFPNGVSGYLGVDRQTIYLTVPGHPSVQIVLPADDGQEVAVRQGSTLDGYSTPSAEVLDALTSAGVLQAKQD